MGLTMKPLLIESSGSILQDYIEHFSYYACEKLGIPSCPPVRLVSSTGTSSFGNYNLSTKLITVATDGRHIADILRTLAHELVHEYQHLDGAPTVSLSELEYEANAIAGMIMRDYNKLQPELYDSEPEETTEAEPQFSVAYQEGGYMGGDPTRPTSHVELAEEKIKPVESDALTLLKLQNKALRAFPSSPYQKKIQLQIKDLKDKMKRNNTPEYHQTLKEDAVVNSVGAGNVDGIGIGSKGEPGIHPNKLHKKDQLLKRKTLQQFKHGLQ